MMVFPEGYFEDEVRDGFFVSSTMKKCWAAQLEVLSDVAYVCDKYNIKWYADCGTLLGAVRHGGFVPWDDDLDICMLRDDYYRFLTVASRELKSIWPQYQILNYHNGAYWEPISRIVNTDIVNFADDRLDKFHGYPLAAGIDIFPLDYVCKNKEEEEARKGLFKTIFELADSDFAESIGKESLMTLAEAVGKTYDDSKSAKLQLYEWGEIVSSLYGRDEAEEVCLMTFWYRYNNHKYPLSAFEKIIQLPFENTYINAPAGYNSVLSIEYGDYMKLVRSGGIHDYPHYEGQIESVEEWLGVDSPFHKSVSASDINKDKSGCKSKKHFEMVRDKASEFIKVLYKIHDTLNVLLRNGQIDELLDMLCQCQDVAIQIGTFIENNLGEGFVTVKHFEQYCECVYEVNESVSQGRDDTDKVLEKLSLQLDVIRDSIENDISKMREVVFVPFKAKYWNVLEGMWHKAKEDPNNKVVVIPIPYYEKNALGKIEKRHYDMDGYPKYVELTDYNEYDFESRRPSQIIIQYPYDNDNFVTAIDKRFYAKNLKNYTDELVYVPYFVTEEINSDDERAYKVMDYYTITPAVVNADKVFVQSDNIRCLYIRKLSEHFGKDTTSLWERRISVMDATDLHNRNGISKDDIEMPQDWREILKTSDGNYKKVVIYVTTISGLFEHRYKMIDKMKSTVRQFEDNASNITMIWRPDPLVDSTIPATDPELYNEYRSFVDSYKDKKFCIYDDTCDKERLLMLADAYYGDTDKLVQECRNLSIPIMIQNVDII